MEKLPLRRRVSGFSGPISPQSDSPEYLRPIALRQLVRSTCYAITSWRQDRPC
jgi:hypothetical protein